MVNFNWNHKTGVYMIYNIKNDKKYIGSSINLYERLHKHFSLLRHNRHENQYLQNAFNKYGKESFRVEILKFCKEESLLGNEALLCEIINPEYNLTKDIIRNKLSPESIEKLKFTLKEGYRTKRIVSKSTKPIMIYDLKGNFITEKPSIKETAIFVKCSNSTVNRTVRKIYKQINGFQLFYKGEEISKNIENDRRFFGIVEISKDGIFEKNCNNYCEAAQYINVANYKVQRKMQKNIECVINGYTLKRADNKREELLETPILERQKDNQQPSLFSNEFEGSTTNSQIQTDNAVDSNANTSIPQL
jgi:hypothetical protein